MTENLSELEAMQAAFVEQSKPVVEQPVKEEIKQEVVSEPIVETQAKVEVEKDSSSENKVEAEPSEIQKEEVKVKSFEEQLAEKTGGKISKWEEVEKVLNAPKEELDEEVRHWNELKKKGIKLDKEFFELQSLNVGKLDDPRDVGDFDDPRDALFEAMKRKPENKGLSKETLLLQISKKYNLEEWQDKEEVDLTPDDKANREIMMRDAQQDLEWLKKYKSDRIFVKSESEAEIQKRSAALEESQKNWENYVTEELFSKIKTISIPTDQEKKEVVDYKISEADRSDIANLMKSFTKDGNALFNRYKETDSQGNHSINHQKLFVDLLKAKVFDETVKHAYNDGKAVGEKKFIKEDLKNINFKPDEGKVNAPIPKTEAEALRQAMEKNNIKF